MIFFLMSYVVCVGGYFLFNFSFSIISSLHLSIFVYIFFILFSVLSMCVPLCVAVETPSSILPTSHSLITPYCWDDRSSLLSFTPSLLVCSKMNSIWIAAKRGVQSRKRMKEANKRTIDWIELSPSPRAHVLYLDAWIAASHWIQQQPACLSSNCRKSFSVQAHTQIYTFFWCLCR
mgnify:CR=1 FL=1